MPIPNFSHINELVDFRLNQILHRALAREPDLRYQTAGEMLYDLEHYIYNKGYGPNE